MAVCIRLHNLAVKRVEEMETRLLKALQEIKALKKEILVLEQKLVDIEPKL